MGNGLLLSLLESTASDERGFNDRLDNEYFPRLMGLAGVLQGGHWVVIDNPKLSVAIFDLKNVGMLKNKGFAESGDAGSPGRADQTFEKCRIIMSFEGEQINPGEQLSPIEASGMLLVASNVAPEFEAEYGDWYDREHLPALRSVPGTLSARRFRATRSTHQFLSLYHLRSPDVQASPAWKKAVDTPWSSKVRPHVRDRLRFVCRATHQIPR